MTLLVGSLLLLVFAAFALAMFLERISALLALPLMAMSFLLIATMADVFQPAELRETVSIEARDDLGRRTVTIETRPAASRFARWVAARDLQERLLHEKAALMQVASGRLLTLLGDADDASLPDRLAAELRGLRAEALAFQARAAGELAPLLEFFTCSPHYLTQRARFWDEFNAFALVEQLAALAVAIRPDDPAATQQAARRIAADMNAQAERVLHERPGPSPAAASGEPRASSPYESMRSACAYVGEYAISVLRMGSLQLHGVIIATIFGGMFAVYVRNLKVAEKLVYWTAEFSGERPLLITLAIFLVTAVVFTSVGGLGTVIMLGTIILPILRSLGLSPIVGAGVFLLAIAMGGTLQPVSRRLWIDLYGLPTSQLDQILWTMVAIYLVLGVGWIWWGTRRGLLSSFSSTPDEAARPPQLEVPARLMIAPLIPVALVYFLGIEEISSFIISITYMYLCVCGRTGATRQLARSLIEGAQTVMPPVLLMIGIGLLVVALQTAPVQEYLRPLLTLAAPQTRWGYILTFALAAPLALYRGPLNVWGMGLAVSATLLATTSLPPAAILCAILAAGMLQGVCDPTNTANVWVAGFQGLSVNQILRWTILPVWAAAAAAVVWFGFKFI